MAHKDDVPGGSQGGVGLDEGDGDRDAGDRHREQHDLLEEPLPSEAIPHERVGGGHADDRREQHPRDRVVIAAHVAASVRT